MVLQTHKTGLENTVCPGEGRKTVKTGVCFWQRASLSLGILSVCVCVWKGRCAVFCPHSHASLGGDVIVVTVKVRRSGRLKSVFPPGSLG